jgi:hypothetical protein
MMGHTDDTYLDVQMVGIEYLRKVYELSGIASDQLLTLIDLRFLKKQSKNWGITLKKS